MTIQELADRAAVTTRTIRYYVEQGVLPPPGRGRPSEYTHEHLRLLDLIRRLKEQYLPLEEIRDMLQRLSPEQVEDFLTRTEPPSQQLPPQDSAADYVSQVLDRGALRSQLKDQAPTHAAPQPAPPPASAPPRTPAYTPENPGQSPQPPLRRSAGMAPQDAAHAKVTNELSRGNSDTAGWQEVIPGEERTWQRVTLAPGVELHYEPRATGAEAGFVRRLIEAARTILGSHPEKGIEEQK
jgi:DNA-binding transcriptional MerR regulator